MLKYFLRGTSWSARAWEEALSPGKVSQDSWAAVELEGRLRVAVIDGATPGYESSSRLGVNSAIWAAAVIRTALFADVAIEEAAFRANDVLLSSASALEVVPKPRAAFAAVDIEAHRVTCVRGGDCVIWLHNGRDWEAVFPGGMLADETVGPYEEWRAAHPSADALAVALAEDDFFSARDAFRTTPLGRFSEPKLEVDIRDPSSVIVVASDGAKLSASRLARLDEWIAGLRQWEDETYVTTAGGKAHDDVTVVRVEASPTAR
jgi:hypothetical protein